MSFWKPGDAQPRVQSTSQASVISTSSSQLAGDSEKTNPVSIPDAKPVLSKSVMSMKFMKRKEEAAIQESEETLKRKKILEMQWISRAESVADADAVLCVKETNDLLTAMPGRRSFGGFNKPVERNYQQAMDAIRFDSTVSSSKEEKSKTITDEEMLERYESLIGLPRGPQQSKRSDQPKFEKTKPAVNTPFKKSKR